MDLAQARYPFLVNSSVERRVEAMLDKKDGARLVQLATRIIIVDGLLVELPRVTTLRLRLAMKDAIVRKTESVVLCFLSSISIRRRIL